MTASGTADDRFYTYRPAAENCVAAATTTDSLVVGGHTSADSLYWAEITFDNVLVPNNATLTSVVLGVQVKRAFTIDLETGMYNQIRFIQSDNANAPNGSCGWPGSGSYATWDFASGSYAANETLALDCGTAALNEIIDRAGWASGNSVTIAIGDGGGGSSDVKIILKALGSYSHTLTVNYTVPTSGVQQYRICAATDDVLQVTGDDVYQTTLRIGNDGGVIYNTGLRFQNVQIPQGSVIDTSFIKWTSSDIYTGATCNATIDGDDTDDAATFSTNANYTGRTRTTASVAWSAIESWSSSGTEYLSPNFTSVPKEIVDRVGWSAGNDMAFFFNNNSSSTNANRRAVNYENGVTTCPVWRVVYSAAASGTTPTRRRRILQMGSMEPQMIEWTQWGRVNE